MITDPKERLMSKTQPDLNSGCWLWEPALFGNGYGRARLNGKNSYAHRLSYSLFKGEIGELHVLHKCDVRCCVNPDHLFLGTASDNMVDMNEKGRGNPPVGERSHSAKLTEDIVMEIRLACKTGERGIQKDLVEKFSVSKATISRINTGRRWKHV